MTNQHTDEMRPTVIKFPKNFCWETNGQLSELIKQAEESLPHLEENSVGYYYYWMLQVLKERQAATTRYEAALRKARKALLLRHEEWATQEKTCPQCCPLGDDHDWSACGNKNEAFCGYAECSHPLTVIDCEKITGKALTTINKLLGEPND